MTFLEGNSDVLVVEMSVVPKENGQRRTLHGALAERLQGGQDLTCGSPDPRCVADRNRRSGGDLPPITSQVDPLVGVRSAALGPASRATHPTLDVRIQSKASPQLLQRAEPVA
jgi:hypothetical protein